MTCGHYEPPFLLKRLSGLDETVDPAPTRLRRASQNGVFDEDGSASGGKRTSSELRTNVFRAKKLYDDNPKGIVPLTYVRPSADIPRREAEVAS